MLSELVVEGLGVIDRAELSLGRGCIALTGETGTGKTLVVAALSLLLGGRADRTLVRTDVSAAHVEGRFVVAPAHPAVGLLETHGILDAGADKSGEDLELVIARTLPADGRGGRARINGRLVTASFLAEVGSSLVEIAGQQAHQRLGSSTHQRHLLDAFAGRKTQALAAGVAVAVQAAGSARRRAEELAATERERNRELDVLRFEIDEISAAALEVGEEARLEAEARRLEHAEALALGIGRVQDALHSEGGAEDLVAASVRELDALSSVDAGLAPLAARLRSAALEIADVAGSLGGRVIVPDAEALESVQARLAVVARLRRKYGADEATILDYLTRAEQRAAEIETYAADAGRWESEAEAHETRARALAEELSAARSGAAGRLADAVEKALGGLALQGARFEVGLRPRALYEGGAETVELRIAANPGEALRPVAKVASGGELARIALALHLLTSPETMGTVAFDEVDAGVGGEAARAVGRALAALAERSGGQVIVVTHLPQVAAFADAHYRVTKQTTGGRTRAAVDEVRGDKRVAELSRMLAGMPRSERAREHAEELLEMAGRRS